MANELNLASASWEPVLRVDMIRGTQAVAFVGPGAIVIGVRLGLVVIDLPR